MRISGTNSTPKPSDLLPANLQANMISHLEAQLELAQAATIEAKAAIGTAEAELAAARRAEREAIKEACAGGVLLPGDARSEGNKIVCRPAGLPRGVGVRGLNEESKAASKAVQVWGARLALARQSYQLACMRRRNIAGALTRCRRGLTPTVAVVAETLRSFTPLMGRQLLERAKPTAEEIRKAKEGAGTVIFTGGGAVRLPHWLRRR